jgi:type I restriction enzyme S subunit
MPFKSTTFGEFLSIQRGHDLPQDSRTEGNVPVAGASGIVGYHNESKGVIPGITIGRSGSIGEVKYYSGAYFPLNTALYVTDFRGNDPRFAYYFLKNFDFTNFDSGSVQPSLNRNFLNPAPIEIPDPQTQKAIAHILGTLDDKIELNQKMNQTLEDIAKAVFKSWFVNFDPVRSKAEGRPTGLPAEISDLFPDAFEDSEIGEIPAGWKITSLGDQTTLTKGRSYKSAELMDSDTALVTLKSFHRGGGYRLDGLKSYTGTYKEDQVLEQGDLIIALTDVTQAADVIGKPAIVRSSSDYSTLVASLDVGIIRAKAHSDITLEYCYFLMLTARYTQHSLGYTTGTTVLHLAKDASAKFEIGLPHKAVIDHYTAIASPLMQRIFAAEKENEILAQLRDTLLPKLISGELRISDAEKFLEEAGI